MMQTTDPSNSSVTLRGLWLALGLSWAAGPALAQQSGLAVSALGRIEPKHGVIRVGAPSTPEAVSGAIVTELRVEAGDDVTTGQVLAVVDTVRVLQSKVTRAQAALVLAERDAAAGKARADEACIRADVADREAKRLTQLREQNLASEEETERAQGEAEAGAATCNAAREEARVADARIAVRQAEQRTAAAELERASIRSPINGRVLEVIARPGELAGAAGVIELAQVDSMYAIAEVYEADIGRVRQGQRARITSPALADELNGTVEHVRLQVQKQDELGTDPAARKDARVVEVEIRIDEPQAAASLTNLQVEVLIGP
jgi:HlyD family secretion protein